MMYRNEIKFINHKDFDTKFIIKLTIQYEINSSVHVQYIYTSTRKKLLIDSKCSIVREADRDAGNEQTI